MMPSPSSHNYRLRSLLLVVAFACTGPSLAAGCAWSEGEPWGVVTVSLETYLAPPASRLTESGHLKTANSYALELTSMTVGVDAVTLVQADGASAGGAVFDPSDPPPGYSLCHNGHCHKDDGSLPTYAEIQAELSADPAANAAIRRIPGPAEAVEVTATPVVVPLRECPDDCWFERTSFTEVRLEVGQVKVQGRVYDQLQGDARRLPPEGLPVAFEVDLGLTLVSSLALEFGPDGEPTAGLDAVMSVPPSLFDGIDWARSDQTTPAALGTALALSWGEADGAFSVTVFEGTKD